MPGYRQESWVQLQNYQSAAWTDLIALWLQFNRHLAWVIAAAPPSALGHTLSIDGRPPVTLAFVMEDYVRHLEHHLGQILE